jgi:hypothetical protein
MTEVNLKAAFLPRERIPYALAAQILEETAKIPDKLPPVPDSRVQRPS